ncbi:MAG: hypothetical protein IJ341_02540 [Bacteroidales bacterium]|nr:hypothetical protein [Bacteroidales bacterium]
MKPITWNEFVSIIREASAVIPRIDGETIDDYNKRKSAYIIEKCVLSIYDKDVEGKIASADSDWRGKKLLLIKREFVDTRFIPCTYDTETKIHLYFIPDHPIKNRKDESIVKYPATLHAIITDFPDDWQDCCRFMLAGNSEKFRF